MSLTPGLRRERIVGHRRDVKRLGETDSAQMILALVALAALVGGGISWYAFGGEKGVREVEALEEEADYKEEQSLRVSGKVSYPISDALNNDHVKAGLVELMIENIRRKSIGISSIEFTVRRSQATGSLGKIVKPREVTYEIVDGAGAKAEEKATTAEIHLVDSGGPGEDVKFITETNGVVELTQVARNPEIKGGESRMNPLLFYVVHPATPEIIKVEAKINRTDVDGKPAYWEGVFTVGDGTREDAERGEPIRGGPIMVNTGGETAETKVQQYTVYVPPAAGDEISPEPAEDPGAPEDDQ